MASGDTGPTSPGTEGEGVGPGPTNLAQTLPVLLTAGIASHSSASARVCVCVCMCRAVWTRPGHTDKGKVAKPWGFLSPPPGEGLIWAPASLCLAGWRIQSLCSLGADRPGAAASSPCWQAVVPPVSVGRSSARVVLEA